MESSPNGLGGGAIVRSSIGAWSRLHRLTLIDRSRETAGEQKQI